MSLNLSRLMFEHKLLQDLDIDSDFITVKPKKFVSRDAPTEYEIDYTCKGLYKDHNTNEIKIADPQRKP